MADRERSIAARIAQHLARGAGDVDFRARLGVQLTAAVSELARERAVPADFRTRLGVQLGAVAAALADERERAAAPPALADFRGRVGLSLASAAGELARERAAPAARSPRPSRLRWLPRLGRPAVVLGVLLCMAGGATASSVWLVQVGNPAYRDNPQLAVSAPPAAQLAALSVLRRPQTLAERGPAVQRALTDINQYTTGVRTNYVRVLESTPYGPVVLVPVEQRNATSTLLGQPALANALCVYYPAPHLGPTVPRCFSTQQLLSDRAFIGSGARVFGLMPDGISSVTVAFGASHLRATVHGNFFDVGVTRPQSVTGPAVPAAPPIPSVTASPSAG